MTPNEGSASSYLDTIENEEDDNRAIFSYTPDQYCTYSVGVPEESILIRGISKEPEFRAFYEGTIKMATTR
jgi:hypothetical protein